MICLGQKHVYLGKHIWPRQIICLNLSYLPRYNRLSPRQMQAFYSGIFGPDNYLPVLKLFFWDSGCLGKSVLAKYARYIGVNNL